MPILRCVGVPFLFISVILSCFGCTIYLVFGIATKVAMVSQNYSPYFSRGTSGQVVFKQAFSLHLALQIVIVMVIC